MQDGQYVAFGLSGRNSGIQMFDSDAVWAWLDNSGVHAQELNINAYSQVRERDSHNQQFYRNVQQPTKFLKMEKIQHCI